MSVKENSLENYDNHWQGITVKDKVVLDLGCDYGSTAEYFLQHGAKRVFGVDNEPNYASLVAQRNLANFYFILDKVSTKLVTDLVGTIRPDTVKVDCERAEQYILTVDSSILRIPTEWYFECHTIKLYRQIMNLFSGLGYTIRDRYPVPDCRENAEREKNDSDYITIFMCRR